MVAIILILTTILDFTPHDNFTYWIFLWNNAIIEKDKIIKIDTLYLNINQSWISVKV